MDIPPNYALVKGTVTNVFSYLRTKVEGNHFLSSYLFTPLFSSLPGYLPFLILFILLAILPPTSVLSWTLFL